MPRIEDYLTRSIIVCALTFLSMFLASTEPSFSQSFTCNFGTQLACLDYGDTVCSSRGKCVDSNASCFDTYQCNYEGFTCRSNLTECADEYEDLLDQHNRLVTDYNELLEDAKRIERYTEEAQDCVDWARRRLHLTDPCHDA